MNFGILGCSSVFEDAVIRPNIIDVVGLVSRNYEKAVYTANKHGIKHVFHTYEEMLSNDLIDAIYIALPPVLQVKWAKEALTKGKRVLVEKPLTIHFEELNNIESYITKGQNLIMEGVMTQHHEYQKYIKELIEKNKYGKLIEISTVINLMLPEEKIGFRNKRELGGGVFNDQASYWLQFVQYMIGLDFYDYELAVPIRQNDVDWEIAFRGMIGKTKVKFEASYSKKCGVKHKLIFEHAVINVNNFFRCAMGNYKLTVEIQEENEMKKIIFAPQNYYKNQLTEFIRLEQKQCVHYWEDTKQRIYWLDMIGKIL